MTKDTIFLQNPLIDEYFKTSDGQAFYHEANAKMHAKRLKDKKVDRITKTNELKSEESVKPKLDAVIDNYREELITKYKSLFGKEPARNIKNETLELRISEKLAESEKENQQASTVQEGANDDENQEGINEDEVQADQNSESNDNIENNETKD